MMNEMIAYANSAGDQWAAWVLAASLEATLLLAVIGLVWFAIRNRVAPQVGYCLFLLVPLKLLVPVVVTVPAVVARWTPSAAISSWLRGAHVPERSENQDPRARPMATGRTVRSPLSDPIFAPRSQSQPAVADSQRLTPDTGARPPIGSTASSLASAVGRPPRLSAPAGLMIVWFVGVMLLLGRLVSTQLRFRARLHGISPLDESKLALDLRELCRRAGAPQTTRFVEQDSIAAPAVWGIIRPTIILPQGIVSSLTAQQLRWVLLHELAHVRRRDLLVATLQRFATILHFFNPAIWIGNRVIHQLREYACDDLAVSLSHSSPVESGEAFVRILQHAHGNRRGVEGALGIFGLDSRASCFLRVRRLLDTERPIRTAPGAWSLCVLTLLAVVAVPQLRAAGETTLVASQNLATKPETPSQQNPNANADRPLARDGQEFELRVVGPDGKPIPEALVEFGLGWDPALTAGQIRTGRFVRQRRQHSTEATADVDGRLVVMLPRAPTHFNVFITIPGYGPYSARWSSDSHAEPIPPRLTAQLDAAWSVGGIIVDGAGTPVEGATVGPNIKFKNRPGAT